MSDIIISIAILIATFGFVCYAIIPDANVERYRSYIKRVIENTIIDTLALYPEQSSAIIHIRKKLLGE